MVKVPQRRNEDKLNICINREKRQRSNRRHMTKEDCERKYSGALQQKVWNLG